MPGRREHRLLQWPGIALFLLIALPWYIAVVVRTPGLLHYFVGSEVVNRVASDSFSRHGEWYGWIVVFGPTLLIGTLPWTLPLLRFLRRLPADAQRWWRDRAQRTADAPWVFLVLWVLLPLIVFCIARSRMVFGCVGEADAEIVGLHTAVTGTLCAGWFRLDERQQAA